MVEFIIYTAKRVKRKIMHLFFSKDSKVSMSNYNQKIYSSKETSSCIKEFILDNNPRLLCRLGNIELEIIETYLTNKKYDKYMKRALTTNAGFFPIDSDSIDSFCRLNIDCMKTADLVGVWFNRYEDILINKYAKEAKLSLLYDLSSPYFSDNPWTEALEGKIVLIIHPFEDSIILQYKNNRDKLFEDLRVLPKFKLKTLKAVQSIGGEGHPDFESWFEALEYMQDKIKNIEFDVAIIGAGAYGLPLGAFIKSLGKTAIHLGGATQILFGIKGKRWEDRDDFQELFNMHWIKPDVKEIPKVHKKVENGCYW